MTTEKRKTSIYLASGWFTPRQAEILTFLEDNLFNKDNLRVYSPRKEMLIEPGKPQTKQFLDDVLKSNLDNIYNNDIMIASTEGKDTGTLFECGVAYAIKKPVFYIYFPDGEVKPKVNVMLSRTGKGVIMSKEQFTQFAQELNENGLTEEILTKYEYNGISE